MSGPQTKTEKEISDFRVISVVSMTELGQVKLINDESDFSLMPMIL